MIANFMKWIFGAQPDPQAPAAAPAAVSPAQDFLKYYRYNQSHLVLRSVDAPHDYITSSVSPIHRAGDIILFVDRKDVIRKLEKYGYQVSLEYCIGPEFKPNARCTVSTKDRSVVLNRTSDLVGRDVFSVEILENGVSMWKSTISETIERVSEDDLMLAGALAIVGKNKTRLECHLASPENLMDRIRFSDDLYRLPFFSHIDLDKTYRLMIAIRNIKGSLNHTGHIGMKSYFTNSKTRGVKARAFIDDVVKKTGASEEDIVKACFLADITHIGDNLKFVDTHFSKEHVQKVIDLYKISYVFSC